MTEKVKVTPKMAELIRNTLKKYERHKIVEKYNSIACDYKNEMDLDTLIKALYIGYEVEPEFKVGDWVVRTEEGNHENFCKGKIFKIKSIIKSALGNGLLAIDSDDNSEHLFKNISHATPSEIAEEKERRWWKGHGRDVWELKKGDLLKNTHNYLTYEVVDVNEKGGIAFVSDIGFRDKNSIVATYKVACFIENRLDVKTNAN